MKSAYLDRLDDRLAAGARLLGRPFAEHHARFVQSKQMPDGGFTGRGGGSDIYYTDFALRTLALLGPDDETLERAAAYVRAFRPPGSVAECFNQLNCARLLARAGSSVQTDAAAARACLDGVANVYDAFLGALCEEMLGTDESEARGPAADLAEAGGGQTCRIAAAAGLLVVSGRLDADHARAAADLIAPMQGASGGFLAHPSAPEPDLLATFTALVTLSDAGALDRADLAAAGRFVRLLAEPGGGFRASASDREPDVEYTYYGVASAALLRAHVADRAA